MEFLQKTANTQQLRQNKAAFLTRHQNAFELIKKEQQNSDDCIMGNHQAAITRL